MKKKLLKDVIDLHLHAGPDLQVRKLTYLEAALQAREAGMKAILIKSHATITADIAALLQPLVPGLLIFGGVALNDPLGGLNPHAVEAALKLGARQVWMPTLSAANHYHHEGKKGGITILSKQGKLKREVSEILDLLSQHDVILSTGHLSLKEIMVLVKEAKRRKIQKILVTHPDHHLLVIPVEDQQNLAREGVYFDRCFPTEEMCVLTMERMAAMIREVGVASTVLSTDFGQPHNPYPVEGMKAYIQELMRQGFTAQEIDQMVKVNPARLLNIA
jgi:hypothetical protein